MHKINAAPRNVLESTHWHSCASADDFDEYQIVKRWKNHTDKKHT